MKGKSKAAVLEYEVKGHCESELEYLWALEREAQGPLKGALRHLINALDEGYRLGILKGGEKLYASL